MNKLICENEIIGVTLEERDTLGDMAMVSGYTMDKLRGMIEEIIHQSIYEEKNRDVCEGGDDDMTNEKKNAIEMQNTIVSLAPLIADMLTDDEELKEEFTAALLQTKVVSIGECAYTVKQGGDTE